MSNFIMLLFICVFIVLLFNPRQYYKKYQILEYYLLIFIATFAGYYLIKANNIISFVLSLELLSISTYALCGGEQDSKHAIEASLKYFLLGVFCSAILMFGFALLYLLTGSISFSVIAERLPHLPLANIAITLVLVGVFFKMALVPFHYWISDIFEGVAAPVVLFIATVVKIVMVWVIGKLMLDLFGESLSATHFALFVCVVLSLVYANFVALRQDNFKRLLAYSAISHSAFIVMPLLAFNYYERINLDFNTLVVMHHESIIPIYYYLIMYCGAISIALIVVHLLERNGCCLAIKSLRGLIKRSPFLSICLGVSILTLAGLPLAFTGLIAKMVVINLLLSTHQILLAILAIVFSIIACGYYIPVLVEIFLKDSDESDVSKIGAPIYLKIVLFVLSCVCIGFGFIW